MKATSPRLRLVGQRVPRIEDPALLMGKGRFVDDITLPGLLHVAFVRSPHAHALIRGIDTAAASAMPGVVAVMTPTELQEGLAKLRMPLGFPTDALPRDITPFVLPPKEVCYVGEAVALVIAASRYVAEDAAGEVVVDYEPLSALVDCRDALRPDAPKVRLESADNVLARFTVAYGDAKSALANAPHVFEDVLFQHRGAAHPMEGRGIVAVFDPLAESLAVWSSTQMSHELKFTLAEMLGLSENRIRVVAPDVGGGFGAKYLVYPEEVAVAAAARMLRQPLKWVEDRLEHFLAGIQERDEYWTMQIGVDAEGRILAIRGELLHDQGAYTPQGINCPYNAANAVTGPYIVPHYELNGIVAQTNKVFTIPVRGAGYPEACYVMERLLDRVAQGLGLDRAEVRLRNLVPPEKMPYRKPIKSKLSAARDSGQPMILDSGDYIDAQRRVLETIDYAGFPERQRQALAEGRYIGIGMGHAVKGTGRSPFESGTVSIAATGRISILTGALPMGQGIKTALAQIVGDVLGVSADTPEVIAGDTAFVALGMGGFASRQTVTAGSSVHLAAERVRQKAIKVASLLLEASEDDLVIRDGHVFVDGVPDMKVPLSKIARLLRGVPGENVPGELDAGLEATFHWQPELMTFANGFHACEVEVDIATGGVRLLRYVALQDSGTLINPAIVDGQIRGGIAQGIGIALLENALYDDDANFLAGTFMDYLLPTAVETPAWELGKTTTPSPHHPIGAKGVGESATVGAPPAIANAVVDALWHLGVRNIDIPLTPQKIWAILREKGVTA